ncbi:MAG: adenylosuccinate synthase [Dehalococcoidales bacterium]|nr:MAG: adenylosuccinate synthase [Dehalococcoidales bacterium]
MSVVAVVGGQWGDEGKGKIVDMLSEKSDMVVRFSGGDNAGHTVVNPLGEFALRLVPSGIFYPQVTCIMGNGVVINPAVLLAEMDSLRQRGIDLSRLYISDRANLIMPYHLVIEGLEEEARGGRAIGTTRKGIGPAFSDKIARVGIRAGDLLDREAFRERLEHILEYKNAIITKVFGAEPLSLDDIFKEYCEYGERLAPRIRETTLMIAEALERGNKVLMEGAQGALLDPDFGTYPFATSSSPLAGEASIGAGFGPTRINYVLGIYKAYCSRVGAGPFPTEMEKETGNMIRERAYEYGVVSGRPRSCGWFDAVVARFTQRINGCTGLAITRLDILDVLPSLKICTGYELDGAIIDNFPASLAVLARCRPVYEELPGWQVPTSDIRQFEQLPPEARQYVARIEELLSCPADIISVGSAREQTIIRRAIM